MPSDIMVMRSLGVLKNEIVEMKEMLTKMQEDMDALCKAGVNVHIHVDDLGEEEEGSTSDTEV